MMMVLVKKKDKKSKVKFYVLPRSREKECFFLDLSALSLSLFHRRIRTSSLLVEMNVKS
jgi:hypothetical protein